MESLFSLNQVANLLKSFPDPAFVLSRHGEYLAVFGGKDPRYYHDGSVLVGKLIQDVVVPAKADWFLEQIDRVLASHELHVVEYSLSGRDVKGLEEGPVDLLWFEGRVSRLPFLVEGKEAVLWVASNITNRIKSENEFLSRQKKQLFSLSKIIMLSGLGDRPDADVCDQIVGAIVELTESQYGYLYFYDEETELFTLHGWSEQVLADCKVVDPQSRYALKKTGFWGEVVRQRRSLINNDFAAVHPLKKGYPEGHAPVTSFMSVPIWSGGSIVAVAGVANKVSPYTVEDTVGLQEFCQGAWNIIGQRQEHRRFLEEQARYRQLFEAMPIPCTVNELLIDNQGIPCDFRFIYVNQGLADLLDLSREEITGRTASELFGEDQPVLLERFAEVVSKGEDSQFEYQSPLTGKHLLLRCYPAGEATFVALAMDVTDSRKLMERRLRDEIEGHERERISRELHDSAGQTFQAIRLYLNLIKDGTIPPAEIHQAVAQLDEEVADAFAELREIAHQLHPEFLSDTSLESAVSDRCKRFIQRGQPITFSCSGVFPYLPIEIRGNFYRIFQEAMSNTVRYSGASQIEVSLQGTGSGVLFRVSDNGRGKRGKPEGFGIRSMRERAELIHARFMIESNAAGTSVTVEWEAL